MFIDLSVVGLAKICRIASADCNPTDLILRYSYLTYRQWAVQTNGKMVGWRLVPKLLIWLLGSGMVQFLAPLSLGQISCNCTFKCLIITYFSLLNATRQHLNRCLEWISTTQNSKTRLIMMSQNPLNLSYAKKNPKQKWS